MEVLNELDPTLTSTQASGTAEEHQARARTVATWGSLLAAMAACSCCVIPLALFTLGISGAWISNLTVLAPYQPFFVALALGFLSWGFWLVYHKPKIICIEDSYCAKPVSNRIAKAGLWTTTGLIALALAFPYITPCL
jgi:mercuric ion transport protein